MRQVALIQNRLQKGGRMHVMLHFIKALNELDINPTIYTLKNNLGKRDLDKIYGRRKLKFKIVELPFEVRMPFEWHILYFNKRINSYVRDMDLVINSNNTSYLLSKDLNLLSYVHFPRKYRNRLKKKDIHFPNGQNKSFFSIKSDPFKIAHYFYKLDKHIGHKELTVANSQFTKNKFVDSYNYHVEDVVVLYPPVDNISSRIEKKEFKIATLGRFAKDKRQLAQIDIGKSLPEIEMNIMGFISSEEYYNSCAIKVEKEDVKNVRLHPNIDYQDLQFQLSSSRFFLHTIKNEPFGITTVQAIRAGCIPIVHNSGGQMEIVNSPDLKYNDYKEIPSIVRSLMKRSAEELDEISNSLIDNVEKYNSEEFNSNLKRILTNKLSN